MRRFYLFFMLSGLLVLGACSSAETLAGPAPDGRSSAVLQDGIEPGSNNGVEPGSNNGRCSPRC